jgi:two-component system sensor histidine kinase KdpD
MHGQRPDPDTLLASLQREEVRAARGRLKIFFGMCSGVGKTYAMLRAAQKERSNGKDVLVGVVETHGLIETESLLAALPITAPRLYNYKGMQTSEMDLEGILARKPRLVLVDQLAHSNTPGSRHPKRYQDTLELLNSGIEVFTTLNVQHIESRADAVRQITGSNVSETVPDSVLELADEIELIDVTPEALLERLREGDVYVGGHAQKAEESFFKEINVTALRELALRYIAERMDKRLRELRITTDGQTVWHSGERLLVAVGSSLSSKRLVRWTRRMAASQGAAWIAVNVESRILAPEAQSRLDQSLALARELGAEVLVTHDTDVAAALVRVAQQNKATQIIVGKTSSPRWLDAIRGGSLVDRLVRLRQPIDIHIVPPERIENAGAWIDWAVASPSSVREYGEALGVVAVIGLAGWMLQATIGYLAVGMFYLLAVVALSLRVGRGPVLVAGIASALIWDYFFIPPIFTFIITKLEDKVLFGIYFVVAIITGQLTARIRAQERNERVREDRTTALFHITRILSSAKTLDDGIFAVLRQADDLLAAQSALLLADRTADRLQLHFAGSFAIDDKERIVAEWAWRNRRKAGRFTDTIPSAIGFHVPIIREGRSLGVLSILVPREITLSLAQRDLIENMASQIALLIERENQRDAVEREKLLEESDKLHRVLFDSVSHELRTPLSVIGAVFENIDTADAGLRARLTTEGRIAEGRLNRLVKNLLDQTRLESGALRPHLVWCTAEDLLKAARDGLREALASHPLEVTVAGDMPALFADFSLTGQALSNLLLNAAVHTPAATPIFVTAGLDRNKQQVFFTVADNGPGFPPAMMDRLFQKFARGVDARSGGLGLGLSIVRGFVAAQGGEVEVGKNAAGGAMVTICLPHRQSEAGPKE